MMGFRFRKSVTLMPGVRLNFSTGGVSVSAGIRGARVNFSKRGVYRTFGIPGTGMYWTDKVGHRGGSGSHPRATRTERATEKILTPVKSLDELEASLTDPNAVLVYAESGRRLSDQQVAAARRRFQQQRRREDALAQAEAEESRLGDIVNCWRAMIPIPSRSFYEGACQVRPFEFDEEAPAKPDGAVEANRLREEVADELRKRKPPSFALRLSASGGGLAVGVLVAVVLSLAGVGLMGWIVGVILGGGTAAGGRWMVHNARRADMEREADEVTKKRWPERVAELRATYRQAYRSYAARHNEAASRWQTDERERTEWARALIQGDTETVEVSISESLADLDFPFETQCDVATSNGRCVYLHLDLPEIEDVIPDRKRRVLKDGRTKNVKRNRKERAADYGTLVAGLGVFLARTAFAAAPTVSEVKVAAYTQRKKRGTGQIVDDYVYDVRFTRQSVEQLSPETADPVRFIVESGGRWEQKASMELKSLEPPEWVQDLPSATV